MSGYPTFKVRGGSWEDRGRGGGREDQRHVQGAMAARAQEGLEELSHVEGRRAAVRRYPSSKVRSNGWAWLEQP